MTLLSIAWRAVLVATALQLILISLGGIGVVELMLNAVAGLGGGAAWHFAVKRRKDPESTAP